MKKIIVFFKLYWLKIVVTLLLLTIIVGGIFFFKYCVVNYFALENFTRKQVSGQMALLLPMFVLVHLVSLPFMFAMQYYFMQGGGLGRLEKETHGKAKADVKWDDIIGLEEAKMEAWEIVKLLKDRHLLKVIGGKIVKGTMMLGPPGCGKTYIAKAIATECKLPMISVAGSEFVGIFVGQGAARMKNLFRQARAMAELEGGCIIFIDEIDSFARHRMEDRGFGGATSHNATINQFLTEMDGLRKKENNIVVIAATNALEFELDSAIMRTGRFDRKIYVTRPNCEERKLMFDFYLKRVQVIPSIDTNMLARKTLWFTPSDIDNMVREAGIIALRESRDTITLKDLNESYDRVAFGMKANIKLTRNEKLWTAYHEAGHAVIAYLTHPTNDVIKATIIPRRGNLGMVAQRPVEELHSSNKEHLLANIKVSVASYVAEKIKFGSTSSGVGGGPGSDFDTALYYARAMVWKYGMGKSGLIGDFSSSFGLHEHTAYISEKTKETLDHDVQDILRTCMQEVETILTTNRELFETFAQKLLEKEELEYDEIVQVFDQFGLKSASRPGA